MKNLIKKIIKKAVLFVLLLMSYANDAIEEGKK
jgi:hypothetical protein